jgi:hypothetical protein
MHFVFEETQNDKIIEILNDINKVFNIWVLMIGTPWWTT